MNTKGPSSWKTADDAHAERCDHQPAKAGHTNVPLSNPVRKVDRASMKLPSGWNVEQLTLAVLGIVVFTLGATVNRDRSNLAVTLVALGVLLFFLAMLLPRLKTITAKLPGDVEISADLLPPSSAVSDQALTQPGSPAADLRGADPYDSRKAAFQEAVTGGPATYVTINLEDGEAWLSSRLYLFIHVLAEIRGIEAVIFTANSNGRNVFVGLCPVDAVIRRLAWAFPWLPMKLGATWDALRTRDKHRPPPRRVSSHDAADLYATFVRGLQLWHGDTPMPVPATAEQPGAPLGAAPPDPNMPEQAPQPQQEWQKLGNIWEHANWLDDAFLKELLGHAPTNESISASDLETQTLPAALTSSTSRYVAVLADHDELQSVVDRSQLLSNLLARTAVTAT